MKLDNVISEAREELHKLIEIRDTLSELVMKASERLDLLVLEYTKGTNEGELGKHILSVYPKGAGLSEVPMIKMQGKWLESCGFPIDKQYTVIERGNELILKPVVFKDGKYVLE